MNILITTKILKEDEKNLEKLNHNLLWRVNDDTSVDDIKKAEVIIGNVDLKLLDYAENLKYIHWEFAGSDDIANHPKIKNKVLLTNSTGCYSLTIAEHVLGMILYFYKNINQYVKNQNEHIYQSVGETRSIYDSKTLIIGFGSIGKEIAKRLTALGGHVTGIKRTSAPCPEYLDSLYTTDKLDDCLKNADIIIMCMPQTKDNYHMMNEERLALLKDNSLLINVGRGSAIDTEALISKLKEGKIQAALDVYEKEPLDKDSELWDLDNCLFLPHTTGQRNLWYTRIKLRELAIKNLYAYLNNEELTNVVDFNTGYKKSNM